MDAYLCVRVLSLCVDRWGDVTYKGHKRTDITHHRYRPSDTRHKTTYKDTHTHTPTSHASHASHAILIDSTECSQPSTHPPRNGDRIHTDLPPAHLRPLPPTHTRLSPVCLSVCLSVCVCQGDALT